LPAVCGSLRQSRVTRAGSSSERKKERGKMGKEENSEKTRKKEKRKEQPRPKDWKRPDQIEELRKLKGGFEAKTGVRVKK